MTLYYRKNGVFQPLGSGGGGGGVEPCPPPPPGGGETPFAISQPAINLISDAQSRSFLDLQENNPNWSEYGSLQIAVVMWRADAELLTLPNAGGVPWTLHTPGALQLGLNQQLHIYTRIKPNFHVVPHSWSGPNARCAGAICNFPNGSRWAIDEISSKTSNGSTCDITTKAGRVNLVAATWVFNTTSGTVRQDLYGRQSFFVRKDSIVTTQSRLHLGFVSGETVVRSYNNGDSINDPPNHGAICISLTYT